MVYIGGVYIPNKSKIGPGLTNIYGIGRYKSSEICQTLNVNYLTPINKIPKSKIQKLFKLLENNYLIEGDLKREINNNINRLVQISCYRGFRHRICLPLRGQRTSTNGRTQKRIGKLRFNIKYK